MNAESTRGMAITGFILSLVGLFVLALPLGITAIILSSISRNRGVRGLATAGLVMGIIDVAFGVIFLATMGRFF